MELNIYKRSVGVNFSDNGQASVVVWGPLAKTVEIDLAGIRSPLARGDHGYWFSDDVELKPGDRYGYMIDGKGPLPDPASLLQAQGVHQVSTAVDLKAHNWNDQHWQNADQSEYIIYELHVGTFSSEGTFEALEMKLDHLIELGITAIEIMPVAEFPGERNWGYDGVFPFAVHHSYGGPADLQKLVDVCHLKGLAVILDVVYNHVGPEGNHLGEFGPYFTEKYKTPWGNAINFDDAWCDGVREYFMENALMWFRDFHIDALRMDAVHAIKDLGPKHILQEISEKVEALMQTTGRRHYLIAECDLNDTRYITPARKGGYGLDGQWIDEFHHALRVSAGQKKDGYYADFNGLDHLAKSYRDAYVYDGQYSEERHKKFGVKVSGHDGQQFIVFSQNHDHVGNRMLGERTSTLVSFEMQKLLAAAVMIGPYVPMLFMGEEYAEPQPFLYFVSHTEPELIEAVRQGRKEEFRSFHIDGEAPDPQAENTFKRSKLQWDLLDEEHHRTMLNYYQALIKLRKTDSVLRSSDRKNIATDVDTSKNTLILKRWDNDHALLCLMNFSDQIQDIELTDQNPYYKLFDTAAKIWNGPADARESIINGQIKLQPESITIYTSEHV